MNRDELHAFALAVKDEHDPMKQDGQVVTSPDRCLICEPSRRHPCDVYELAEAVLELLDEGEDKPLGGPLNLPPMEGDPLLLDEGSNAGWFGWRRLDEGRTEP